MACQLCKQHYPMIDGFHYDEGGFLECEDLAMHNKGQSRYDQNALHSDAQRSEILDILKSDGPCHPGAVSRATGMHVTECRYHLEVMKNRGEIDYSFTRGYSV